MKHSLLTILISFGCFASAAAFGGGQPLGTAFTYQGQLKQGGAPYSGPADFEVTLWDAPTGPAQVAGPLVVLNATITDGLFTAPIDFGSSVFNGEARWLQIAVRAPAGSGAFVMLTPRQPLTAVPYALRAASVATVSPENLPSGGAWALASNLDFDSGTLHVDPASNRVGIGTPAPSQVLDVAGNAKIAGWIGTDANQPVDIYANNNRVFRFIDATAGSESSPNVIGGVAGNSVGANVIGATIGGGGSPNFSQFNSVSAKFGTIGGGLANECAGESGIIGGGGGNSITQLYGTIGGGLSNSIDAVYGSVGGGNGNVVSGSWGAIGGGIGNLNSGQRSVIGGGAFNNVSGNFASVAGGEDNDASGTYAAIGGGQFNIVAGAYGTVPGGKFNEANGDFSFAAGLQAKANHPGTFVWAHNTGTDFASTGAGQFLIRAGGGVGINTNAPGKTLTVAGDVEIGTSAGDYQHLRVGGGNSSGFLYGAFGTYGDGIHIGYNFRADNGPLVNNTGGATSRIGMGYGYVSLATGGINAAPVDRLFVNSVGSVGIATSSPGFTLHVNGSAGKPGGGSWSVASDRRLKKNVEPLRHSLDQLLTLRGVNFEYIDPQAVGERSGPRIGMIAQEVEQVFPDWIDQRADGFKTLTYRGFEALAVEALRELRAEKDAQIEELRREKDDRIAAQEAMIDNLMRRVEALERDTQR